MIHSSAERKTLSMKNSTACTCVPQKYYRQSKAFPVQHMAWEFLRNRPTTALQALKGVLRAETK